MEWSNELIMEFLDLYEREPVIWNPEYNKDRSEVYEAWKRIESKISAECSYKELKRKKEALMASYRKLTMKVRNSTRTDELYKPEWFAYDKMASFLNSVYNPRNTKSTEGRSLDQQELFSYEEEDTETLSQPFLDTEHLPTDTPPVKSEPGVHPLWVEVGPSRTTSSAPPPQESPTPMNVPLRGQENTRGKRHRGYTEEDTIPKDATDLLNVLPAGQAKLPRYTEQPGPTNYPVDMFAGFGECVTGQLNELMVLGKGKNPIRVALLRTEVQRKIMQVFMEGLEEMDKIEQA